MRVETLSPGLAQETRLALSAMTAAPSQRRARAIDRTIRALKQAGIWDKIEVLSLFRMHAKQAALINLKAPTAAGWSETGTVTFAEDAGIYGDAANGLDLPAISAWTVYKQTAAHMMVQTGGDGSTNSGGEIGIDPPGAANDTAYLVPRNASNLCVALLNRSGTGSWSAANTDGRGVFFATRTGTALASYRNGAQLGTFSNTATALDPTALPYACYSTRPVLAVGFGDYLTAAEVLAYGEILTAYGDSL